MSHTTHVRRENLPAAVAAALRARLRAGQLRPGERLSGHRSLAAEYGVSVGSLREALSMLASEGLIETRPGKGTFVADAPRRETGFPRPLTRGEVEELVEARRVIEGRLAEFAAERATAEQLDELRRSLEAMEAASSNVDRYPDADVDFHLALAAAANNRYLLAIMHTLRPLLRDDMSLGAEALIRRFGDTGPSVASHRQLLERIVERDAEGARDVAEGIIRRNERFVLALYDMADGDPAAGRT